MKLIWTYDGKMSKGDDTSKNRIILINYYVHSILTAKKFGYTTIIYCDSESKKYFDNIVDELVVVDSYEDSIIWDYMKVKVLEDREDDFYLIDGDVILHDKLPPFRTLYYSNYDIVFDTYETANWRDEYMDTVIQLDNLNIKNVIPYWVINRLPIISTGVLFLHPKYRKEYVSEFKKCNSFINKFKSTENFHKDHISLVGGQFLLTIFCETNYLSKMNINNNMGDLGTCYKHHFGKTKFNNPIVPTDYMITKDKMGLI